MSPARNVKMVALSKEKTPRMEEHSTVVQTGHTVTILSLPARFVELDSWPKPAGSTVAAIVAIQSRYARLAADGC